jgi:hypothetical protein
MFPAAWRNKCSVTIDKAAIKTRVSKRMTRQLQIDDVIVFTSNDTRFGELGVITGLPGCVRGIPSAYLIESGLIALMEVVSSMILSYYQN